MIIKCRLCIVKPNSKLSLTLCIMALKNSSNEFTTNMVEANLDSILLARYSLFVRKGLTFLLLTSQEKYFNVQS